MKLSYNLAGTTLTITAAAFGTIEVGEITRIKGIEVVDCGYQKVNGKRQKLAIRIDDKPELRELLIVRADAQQAKKQADMDAIISGQAKIVLRWVEGEILGGWMVNGVAAKLLEELGVARFVEGWGYHVAVETVKKIGAEFAYADAIAVIGKVEIKQEQAEVKSEDYSEERAELEKSGVKLATEAQISRIVKATDWRDLPYSPPSGRELALMTRERASTLIDDINFMAYQ